MIKIPVFYRPEQSSDAANSYSSSAGKPKQVVADWLAHPEIAPHIQVNTFNPADDEILFGAHDQQYVEDVLACRVENGFGNRSPEIAASLRYTVGSMVAACKYVLTTSSERFKVAVSPTSGFHHAGYSFGGGFCTFNGLMAAAIRIYTLGLAKRILIIDMDQHYGDGSEDIIATLGIDYVTHITARKSYRDAASLFQCLLDLYATIPGGDAAAVYDLLIFQAGADIHVDDPLGGILSSSDMGVRDSIVFGHFGVMRGIPTVWNLAGGYQRSPDGGIEPVLALHRQTMMECLRMLRA